MSALKVLQIITLQKQLAACWTIWGSNSGGSKKFSVLHTHADRTWGPLNLLYNVTVDLSLD